MSQTQSLPSWGTHSRKGNRMYGHGTSGEVLLPQKQRGSDMEPGLGRETGSVVIHTECGNRASEFTSLRILNGTAVYQRRRVKQTVGYQCIIRSRPYYASWNHLSLSFALRHTSFEVVGLHISFSSLVCLLFKPTTLGPCLFYPLLV